MRGKYGDILKALKGTNKLIFILGFISFTFAISIASIRLKLIIESQGIAATFYEALSLTFIGYFFNNFLPTSIGGDFVKAYYLSNKTHNKLGAYASVFIDRFIGLITMIFMAFIALLFVGESTVDIAARYMIYAITAIAILMMALILNKNFAKIFSVFLLFVKPIEEKLRRAYNAIHMYKSSKRLVIQSTAISVVSQSLFFVSIGILAFSIGSPIPITNIFLMMPIIGVLSLLPSINGLGLREGSTVVFFGPIIGNENAFAVSILWLLVLLMTSLIGGIIYLVSPQFKIKLKEIEKEEGVLL